MELYHGSEKIIQAPQINFRNPSNDFGSGFYCTESIDLAGEWACRKARDGFINHYSLDMDGLRVCYLNRDYHILNWLALLTKYRGYWQRHTVAEEAKEYLQEHYLPDLSEFDLIIGYRADDSYFSFAQDFISGTISLQKLKSAMYLGKLGEQMVLKSEKAFAAITFLGYERALAENYYEKKVIRDLNARRAYAENKKEKFSDEIYVIDILRGRVTDDELGL